jgi:hypothetical protein
MTISLKFITYELELGDAVKVAGVSGQSQSARVDIVASRGQAYQSLGSESAAITLSGHLLGANRYDYFNEFERFRMMGRSLILETPEVKTCVFIDRATIANTYQSGFEYSLTLRQARFFSMDRAEDIAHFWGFENDPHTV